MRVGILGSGLMGGKLGTIFARRGTRSFSVTRARRRSFKALLGRRVGRPGRGRRGRLLPPRMSFCWRYTGRGSPRCFGRRGIFRAK